MADRRMFAKTIIDSDAFLDMPQSTQNLYFHLCMRADDDGFINNPKKVQRTVNGSDDDAKLLCAKNFIIPFESGIIVIKHWRIHNYLRADRYKPTVYQDEKAMLDIKDNGAYTYNVGIPIVNQMETQVRIGKVRVGKDSIERPDANASSKNQFHKPTIEEVKEYCTERGNEVDANKWMAHYDSVGWRVGKNPMKDWKAAVRTWEPDGHKPPSPPKSKPSCPKCGRALMDGVCPVCRIYEDGRPLV
jgi:hypothetical protein